MDITMSRVRLASDTCDIYFTYTKVNHLLYTCSLDTLEDGILLDTSPVCMHRYCRSFTDVKGEYKRQGTTTPSTREAWKRRRKKGEEEDGAAAGARPDIRTAVRIIRAQPDHPDLPPNRPEKCAEDSRRLPPKPDHPGLRPDHPDPPTPGSSGTPSGSSGLAYAHESGRGPCTHSAPSLTPSWLRL